MIDLFSFTGSHRWLRMTVAWAATLSWAFVIFRFSEGPFGGSMTAWVLEQGLRLLHLSVSPPTFNVLHHALRKSAHVAEYACFGVLIYFSLDAPRPRLSRFQMMLASIALAGIYSLTDEYHQTLVPGRGPSLRDCGIDTFGAALGILALYHDVRRSQASIKSPAAPNASADETKNGVAGV